ncbi:MAG: hypothetical protein R3E13_02855 [Alphaproteobacteria bacterium]
MKKYGVVRAFFIFVTVLFAACFGGPQVSYAQKVTEQFNKPMPEFELTGISEFKKATKVVVKEFQKDPALDYEVRVPENWTELSKGGLGDIAVSDKILGELGKFYGPPSSVSARSRLVIEAEGLQYYMTAYQWLVQYLLANGYNLQGMKVYDDKNAEALYVLIEDDVSYAVRAVARLNGSRVVFAQHFIPVERWHDEKVVQSLMLNSFHLKNEVDGYVEEMEEYQFLDFAEFKYPKSWTLETGSIRTIDRMGVELLSTEIVHRKHGKPTTRLDGQINVNMVSVFVSDTLEDEIERFREDLAKKNLNLGDFLEYREEFLFGDKFDFVDTQVFKATASSGKLIDHELWLTVMAKGEYYYFVSLFTPSRDEDYFTWARNTETYKLIVSTIEPKEGAVLE